MKNVFCGFALAGVLAQLVEHHNGIVGVKGSNPLGSTSLAQAILKSGGERGIRTPDTFWVFTLSRRAR
jgi:hypothetical protein